MVARHFSAVALALGMAAAAGCGSAGTDRAVPGTVDAAAVETQIAHQISVPGASVSSVKCPDDVKAESSASFQCSVALTNGATGKVNVTQQRPSSFTYSLVSGSVQVPGATVEQSLRADLTQKGYPEASVNCPDTIIVKLDTTVTCDVTGAQGAANGTITFGFSSAAGTIDTSSIETA